MLKFNFYHFMYMKNDFSLIFLILFRMINFTTDRLTISIVGYEKCFDIIIYGVIFFKI